MQARPAQVMKGRSERRWQLLLFQPHFPQKLNETVPPTQSHLTPHLAAVFCAFTAVNATFTSLLAQETTAHDRQAGHQAATVLLLLRRRSLLHRRRLLVAHLLRRVAILLGRWAVALLLGWVLSLRRAGCDVLADIQSSFVFAKRDDK